jgi:hypothetical protein
VPQTASNIKCLKIYSADIKCPWVEAFPIINRKLFEHHRDMKRTEGTPKTLGEKKRYVERSFRSIGRI